MKTLRKIFGILWSFVRIIWYWFERIFLIAFLLVLAIGLAWWTSQKPSIYRDWDSVDAILPQISWSGTTVTIKNIRNHTWITDTEFTPGYYDDTYNIDDIDGVSYVITPFSTHDGPAHTMLTFSFSDGRHLAISAEIRKEKGESFDAVGGILNQYELLYVIASEDDIIKLRTNYRKNEVYMYPIKTDKEKIKGLFQSMLVRANKLTFEPEFYNTLWNNCTTSVLDHANALRREKLKGGKYTILPSHSDELIYSAGLIDTKLTIQEARSYYRIDENARDDLIQVKFSDKIRKPIR